MQLNDINRELVLIEIKIKENLIEINNENIRILKRNSWVRTCALLCTVLASVLIILSANSLEHRALALIHIDLFLIFIWYATGSDSLIKKD